MSRKPTARDCSGCRDDFYNHNRMGLNEDSGKPRCWSLDSADLVKARDVPIDMRPPFKHIPLTTRPACFRTKGYVRVRPEQLTSEGYWK